MPRSPDRGGHVVSISPDEDAEIASILPLASIEDRARYVDGELSFDELLDRMRDAAADMIALYLEENGLPNG